MNTELMLKRIEQLCANRGISKKTAFVESGAGKNFEYNLKTSSASKKNIQILAQYFGVPEEYLTGEIDERALVERAVSEVVEWLEDNGFSYSTDENGQIIIEKDGQAHYFVSSDFEVLCMKIKEISRDGFEIAMRDFATKHFVLPPDNLQGIDFALSGEISKLTDAEKQDILDYIRFKKSKGQK